MIIITSSIEEAKKQLKLAKRPRFVIAQNEKFNRALLEHGDFDILVANHKAKKQDTLRSLDLTISDVLARIAAKNSIALGFDLESIRSLSPKEQAQELARVSACIVLCRKTGMCLALLNTYTHEGAHAFLRTFGASSQQASQALSF